MKHKLLGKQNLDNTYLLIEVELIPESDKEKTAIKHVEAMDADEEQRELIDNYLLFGLNIPYSIVAVKRQNNTRFILKATSK